MTQDHTHRNQILPFYPNELLSFPCIRQNHSTPSFNNNPDSASYHDILSKSPDYNQIISPEPFNSNTSNETISQYQTTSSQKYQSLFDPDRTNDLPDTSFDSLDSNYEVLRYLILILHLHFIHVKLILQLLNLKSHMMIEHNPTTLELLIHPIL